MKRFDPKAKGDYFYDQMDFLRNLLYADAETFKKYIPEMTETHLQYGSITQQNLFCLAVDERKLAVADLLEGQMRAVCNPETLDVTFFKYYKDLLQGLTKFVN